MITPSRLTGLTVRLRFEMLEARTPASSLLDLAYLGLATSNEPFADLATAPPFVGLRPALDRSAGFDRPHTWAVPVDAGKMADTQPATASPSQPADRRGDQLEIDTPAERQPVFTLPAGWQPAAPAGDAAPTLSARVAGAGSVVADGPPAVVPGTPLLWPPAPQLPARRDDVETAPTMAASSYSGPGSTGPGHTAPAPTGYVTAMTVQEVDFRPDNLIRVFEDPGRTPYKGGPDAPEWRDDNIDGYIIDSETEWSVPVAYDRKASPVVKAKFKITGHKGAGPGTVDAPPDDIITIRGRWGGSDVVCKAVKVTVAKDAEYVEYPPTQTSGAFLDYVDSLRSADITWEFTRTGVNETWIDAGTSSNRLFVTLAAPAAASPVYHTLISLSTRASWGATDAKTVVNKTYEQFTYRTIQAVNPAYSPPGLRSATHFSVPQPLHYYKSWTIPHTKTYDLLDQGDGQCRAWTRFFTDTVRMHGDIPVETRRVSLANTNGKGDKLFAVTLWNFTDNKTFPQDFHPYANVTLAGVDPRQRNESGEWEYQWHAPPDVQDFVGAAGQNVENPSSLFDSHFIVAYDDGVSGRKLYDPSYGTGPFTSFSDWENESVSALVGKVTVTGNDSKNYDLYLFRPNLGAADLREDPAL